MSISVTTKGKLSTTPLVARATRAVRSVAKEFVQTLTRTRMSGRPGLIRRSGSLARSLTFTTSGTTLKTVRADVGFNTAEKAMVARVQELGTVGAGGILPDIVPRSKKLLAWPLRKAGTARGRIVGYAFAKKVAIPPRLKFFDTFNSAEFRARAKTIIKESNA